MEKQFVEYVPGDMINGKRIAKIFGATNKFIVYQELGQVYPSFSATGIPVALKHIRPLLTEISGLYSSKSEERKYLSRIASAFVECLAGNSTVAIEILKKTKEIIIKTKIVKSKLYYISSCLCFVTFNIVISYFLNSNFANILSPHSKLLYTIATFGSLGGFLSVFININKLDLDIMYGVEIQIIIGLSRIFISMISSLIVYSFIKSNLVLGIINDVNNNYIFYALAVVSGFSETFVPNIIKSIEKEKTT